MNNTTTYNRSMFGLTEVNADTINANNLVLSGPLQVNTITSTAAGQSLSIDALGTGTLSLNSGGVTKMSMTNTNTDFYSNQINVRTGYRLRFYDSVNTLIGQLYGVNYGFIYNTTALHYFQISGVNKLVLGVAQNISNVPMTAPTEAVGSNNTRLATTEFVTTATLGLTGITYSNVGSVDMTTIDNNVTINKILSIPSYPNVESTLTSLSSGLSGVTGITYDDTGGIDMTTIDNNVTISTGKTLSIPSFSNVGTTLTTLTTNATGITYSEPYPLYVPQTTINQNLILATNKKFTCDESWTKLYSTHDLTDTIGVGYFKGFLYNNGSILTLSTINPIDVYDGTSTEIVLKCGSQETIFGLGGMSLNWGTITLCTDIELPTYTSLTGTLDTINTALTGITYSNVGSIDTTTLDNNLIISANKILALGTNYPNVETTLNQLNATKYEDEFLNGVTNNIIPWTLTGTGTAVQISDQIGFQGIFRMTASNDRVLYPTSANNIFFWTGLNRMDFFIRVNFTNDYVTYNVGLSDNNTGTGNAIVWSYQNTSPYDWTLRVNGLPVTGTSGVITAYTGDWLYGSLINTKVGAKTIRAYLKNMTTGQTFDSDIGNVTLISTTAQYRPYFRVTNTGGTGTKSLDIDYVSIDYAAARPNPP